MPRMPGLQLIDPRVRDQLNAGDRYGIAQAMRETLARLQTLTWPCTGEYDLATDTIQPLSTGHGEWIVSRIRHNLRLAILLSDRTTGADVDWVERLIVQGQDALSVPFQPRFVMQDYREGNTVAECRSGTWHISGVFDFMEPYFGDGEADLCRSVAAYVEEDPRLARAFVSAYVGQARAHDSSLRPGFADRLPVYMLLDRLIIWQFGQQHGAWWDPEPTLREWACLSTSADVF